VCLFAMVLSPHFVKKGTMEPEYIVTRDFIDERLSADFHELVCDEPSLLSRFSGIAILCVLNVESSGPANVCPPFFLNNLGSSGNGRVFRR